MAKYKVERYVGYKIEGDKQKSFEEYHLYKRYLFGWKHLGYKPTFSLVRSFMKHQAQVKEWQFVDMAQ